MVEGANGATVVGNLVGDEVRHGGRAVPQDTSSTVVLPSSPVSETLAPITIEVLLHCMLYFCVLRQSDRRTLQ